MKEKATIYIRHHQIYIKGNLSEYHQQLAVSKLKADGVEPTRTHKIVRFVTRIGKTILAKTDMALNKKPQAEEPIILPFLIKEG